MRVLFLAFILYIIRFFFFFKRHLSQTKVVAIGLELGRERHSVTVPLTRDETERPTNGPTYQPFSIVAEREILTDWGN